MISDSRSPYTTSAGLLGFLAGLAFTLLVSSCSSPLTAEESGAFPLGDTGLAKGDITFQLYQGGLSSPVADPGITLSESSELPGWYTWEDLPDVEAGATQYLLLWEYATTGYGGHYVWPLETRTPQAIINRVSFSVTQNPLDIGAGATIPSVSTLVTGLAADPTGGSATFTLWNAATNAVVLSAVPATLADIDQLADGTWEVSLTHDWLAAETSSLSGSYYGRFTLTLPGGGVLIVPPAPGRLQVRVYP